MKHTQDPKQITCKCGAIISDEDVDYYTGCNELGEDYGVVSAECPICKAEYETSAWGSWKNKQEAVECLADYIS